MEAKGTAVQITPLFVKKRFGNQGFERWLTVLEPPSREMFTRRIRISAWYPMKESLLSPTRLACELFFDDAQEGAKEIGRFSARHNLRGVYANLVRFSSTKWIINRGSQAINLYYRPAESELEVLDRKKLAFRITYFPEPSRFLEDRNIGWIQQAGAMSGAKEVEVKKTLSLARGDALTEYLITWK